VFLLGDKSLEGDGLVELYSAVAPEVGIRIVGTDRMDPRADDYRDLAAEIAKTRPDAVYFGGAADSNAARLWRDLHDALPRGLLIGSNNLLEPSFYGRLGPAERRTYLTSVAQHPSQLPPAGRRFARDYTREFGEPPDPLAAYGYAAMSLVLNALDRAGGDAADREQVVKEALDTTDFNSVVGRFSIDDNGDTTLDRIAGYRVRGGQLVYEVPLRGRSEG